MNTIFILILSSYHSLFPSRLLCNKLNIKIYKTIILPGVLYECETWCLKLREKFRVFECTREYLDLREKNWQEAGEYCIMRSFINFTLHHILLE
jgi:hypothetical protein